MKKWHKVALVVGLVAAAVGVWYFFVRSKKVTNAQAAALTKAGLFTAGIPLLQNQPTDASGATAVGESADTQAGDA